MSTIGETIKNAEYYSKNGTTFQIIIADKQLERARELVGDGNKLDTDDGLLYEGKSFEQFLLD